MKTIRKCDDAAWVCPPAQPPKPLLSCRDLPDIAAKIASDLDEIHTCATLGVLEEMRGLAEYSRYVTGNPLWQYMTAVDKLDELASCPKRDEWIDFCLRRFLASLAVPEIYFSAIPTAKKSEFVVIHEGAKILLRDDQVLQQRHWGVGFTSPDPAVDHRLAKLCLHSALAQLHTDIRDVNRLCSEWSRDSTYLNTVSFSHERRGNLFENLILGILNHSRKIAVQSSMLADVREWTDLIISQDGRLQNSKIQIKFLWRESDHDSVVSNRRADRTIVVSPLYIARHIEREFEPGVFRCSWPEFLDLFPVLPVDEQSLSLQLYWLFYHLFDATRTHPLSPIIDVPYPLRVAIIALVAKQGMEIKARRLARTVQWSPSQGYL